MQSTETYLVPELDLYYWIWYNKLLVHCLICTILQTWQWTLKVKVSAALILAPKTLNNHTISYVFLRLTFYC